MFSSGQKSRSYIKPKSKICLVASSKYENSPRCIRAAVSLGKYFNVEVVAFNSQKKTKRESIIEGIKVTELGSSFWSEIGLLKLLFFFWKILPVLIKKRADVYHCSGFPSLIVTIPIKFFFRKKILYDCYEHYPYQFTAPALNKTIRESFIWTFILCLENVLARLSDHVIVVPSYNNILLERFKRYKQNFVSEVWNLPPLNMLDKGKDIKKNGNKQVLLHVGGIGKSTGVFKILKATSKIINEFPNIKVLMIGPINRQKKLFDYIKNLGIEKNVEILKQVTYFKIWKIYRRADIGLVLYQPTFWTLRTKASEKLFENMLFSLPIVVSNFPGLKEILKAHNNAIFVDPTNVEEISRGVIKLLKNSRLAFTLGKNGRRAILTKYNWELEEHKLIDIYSHFLL